MDRVLLSKCTCFAVRRTARALTQMYDAALAPAGIRSTQYAILAAIGEKTDISVHDLANAMVMDRTTMGRNLRLLERDGLVVVGGSLRTEAADRRVDQARIDMTEPGVVDPQALRDARAVVLDQDVGAADEPAQDLLPLGLLEVERQALLAPAAGHHRHGHVFGGGSADAQPVGGQIGRVAAGCISPARRGRP